MKYFHDLDVLEPSLEELFSTEELGKVSLKQENLSDIDILETKNVSSFVVFLHFAEPGSAGRSRILEEDCFNAWVQTRKKRPKQPELSFRKALIAHVKGKDSRRPFPPHLEPLVLQELRRKQVWPCFAKSEDKKVKTIGVRTFQSLGFHESIHYSREHDLQQFLHKRFKFDLANLETEDETSASVVSAPDKKDMKDMELIPLVGSFSFDENGFPYLREQLLC
eukprot:snap_masked-scaffold_1-processed-gene-18.34-mRNA-1 protein AED:1.00 eAED:1.00 QI:0/-1/0/0/-1/1/1/0/221